MHGHSKIIIRIAFPISDYSILVCQRICEAEEKVSINLMQYN